MSDDISRPCPFCGAFGDGPKHLTCVVWDHVNKVRYVECGYCHARGPVSSEWDGAWDAWNSRS